MSERPDNPLMDFKLVFGLRMQRTALYVAVGYTFLVLGLLLAGSDSYHLLLVAAGFFVVSWFFQRRGEQFVEKQLSRKFLYAMLRREYQHRKLPVPKYIQEFQFPTETVAETEVGGLRISPAAVTFDLEDYLTGVNGKIDHVFLAVDPDAVDGVTLAAILGKYFHSGSIMYHLVNPSAKMVCAMALNHFKPETHGNYHFSFIHEDQWSPNLDLVYRHWDAAFHNAASYRSNRSRFHFLGVGGNGLPQDVDFFYHLERFAKLAGFDSMQIERI